MSISSDQEAALFRAAQEGGRIIRQSFRCETVVSRAKSSIADWVTEVDLRVQETVCRVLESAFPGVSIVAEEGRAAALADEVLVVDPLDGTLNFLHGYGQAAVSMGYWRENKPVAGVVYNPLTEEMFHSVAGRGAFRNRERIRCSHRNRLSECLLVTGWPYDRGEYGRTFAVLSRFASACQEVRVTGSASLNLCYVASGVFDGYWEWDLYPWDMAGGAAIASEAGCRLTGLGGNPYALADGEVLVAGEAVHREMLGELSALAQAPQTGRAS